MQSFDFWVLQVLIGCDGVHSFVAQKLGLAEPIYSGRMAVLGLAVFPEGHEVREDVLQLLDVGKRGGVVPLNDKEIYWFISFNAPKGWYKIRLYMVLWLLIYRNSRNPSMHI